MNWIPISKVQPPEDKVVMTKISENERDRNVQRLKRKGNLYWHPDGSMYVYYTPTHWAEIET